MAYQKAYCSINEFDKLFLGYDTNIILEKILSDFCDIYMDLNMDEIEILRDENPIFKSFMKRDVGTIFPANDDFESIKVNNFSPFLNDILVLNEDFKTDDIRNHYGILAIKTNEIEYLESLDYHFGYSFQKGVDNKFTSWGEVFKLKKVEPLNSAIIIDNYLWNNIDDFHNENIENLYDLFEYLIPSTLKIPFHISIITSNNKGFFNNKFTEKLNKIAKNLTTKTGVAIEISFSTHTDSVKDDLHERVILTNYHYIYSDKGFYVFKNGKVELTTKGDRNWVFKDIQNYYGEIRKHHHFKNLISIKKRISYNDKNGTATIFNLGNLNNPLLN